MTKALTAIAALLCVMGVSGCMIVDSPVKGVFGSEVRWGDFAQGDTKGQKEGKACMDTILGLFARGDASVHTAKENGNVKEITVIDHTARNLLGIVGEYCTIVWGN